tara:strand:- start:405 stop:884 length:480 start_codon:yes stop_codon:yes gene_type:complete
VIRNDPENPIGLVPEDYASYQIFEKDDLVFKLIDLGNISTSRVGLVPEQGIMSSAYIRVVPGKSSLPKFAYYYYYSLYLNHIYNFLGSGVRSTLSFTDLLNLPYIEPPQDEQKKIVDFLDKKTQQINKKIATTKRLVETLLNQRTALIYQMVLGQRKLV